MWPRLIRAGASARSCWMRIQNRIVGVHLVGSYASEMILSAAMMVDSELPPERIKQFVFPHPTVCEVIREAIFKL